MPRLSQIAQGWGTAMIAVAAPTGTDRAIEALLALMRVDRERQARVPGRALPAVMPCVACRAELALVAVDVETLPERWRTRMLLTLGAPARVEAAFPAVLAHLAACPGVA
jgi:hypothetical protein